MRWNRGRIAACCALVVGLIVAAGCVENDVLESGYFSVAFAPTATQTGTVFDCVIADVRNLRLRRADGICSATSPKAGALCGNNDDCGMAGLCEGAVAVEVFPTGIQLLPSALPLVDPENPQSITINRAENVTFTGDRCRSEQTPQFETQKLVNQPQFKIPRAVLSSGDYFVSRLELSNPMLVDDTGGTLTECSGAINVVQSFSQPVLFKVGKGQPNVVNIDIKTAVLESLLLSGGGCPSGPSVETFLTIP